MTVEQINVLLHKEVIAKELQEFVTKDNDLTEEEVEKWLSKGFDIRLM